MTTRDAMLQKAEARLKQIDAVVDRLRAKAEGGDADITRNVNEALKAVKQPRMAFENRMNELKDAGEGALADLRDRLERAWTSLIESVQRAAVRFQ